MPCKSSRCRHESVHSLIEQFRLSILRRHFTLQFHHVPSNHHQRHGLYIGKRQPLDRPHLRLGTHMVLLCGIHVRPASTRYDP